MTLRDGVRAPGPGSYVDDIALIVLKMRYESIVL
jgi:hypothetical protein